MGKEKRLHSKHTTIEMRPSLPAKSSVDLIWLFPLLTEPSALGDNSAYLIRGILNRPGSTIFQQLRLDLWFVPKCAWTFTTGYPHIALSFRRNN